MNLTRLALGAGVILLAFQQPCVSAEAGQAWPTFQELYGLLRSNLANVSESELNRAAVQGLLNELQPSVLCITNAAAAIATERGPLVSKATNYEGSFCYLRPDRVEAGVAEELASSYGKIKTPGGLKGMVLDLRFVGGQDYAAAAAFADRFFKTEQPLLDWQSGSARATAKSSAWDLPLMILVNRQTAGAAEALAAALQHGKIGLVIGSHTAGQAQVFKEFQLAPDFCLRVAIANIKVGEDHALSSRGLTPDILVNVPEAEEKAYLTDPYRGQSRALVEAAGSGRGGTNRLVSRRVNEADLMRRQREGLDPDRDMVPGSTRDSGFEKPIVRDPVLARALDLLKGIAVVQQSRQP
jgi:hypothetical protein